MKKSLLLLLILTANLLFAQVPIDSLESQLNLPSLSDSARIEVLNQLAREYIFISRPKSIQYSSEALQLSQKTGNLRGEGYAHRTLSSVYYLQEQFFASAEFIERAISIFEQLKDTVGLANCYVTLGNTNRRRFNYGKSIEYHEKALSIFRKKKLPERIAVTLHNLAFSQMLNGDLPAATANITEAITLLKSQRDLPLLTACYRVQGILEFKKGNLEEAKKNLLKVLEISETLGNYAQKEATCEAFLYLGKIAEAQWQLHDEQKYVEQAIKLAEENQYQDLLHDGYIHYIRIDLRKRDFKSAQANLQYFNTIQDSLTKVRHQNNIRLLDVAMGVLKTSELNKQLQRDKDLKDQTIKTQEKEIIIFIITLISVVLLTAILFYFYYQRRKHNTMLVHLNKIILEKSRHLEKINDTKSKFFSIVAHDIRSPLNTLRSFVHLMHHHEGSISKEDKQALMKDLDNNLTITMQLADRLIQWARTQMETVETAPEKIQLYQLTKEAVNVYITALETKNIELHIDVADNLVVFADQNHLEFIIRNLVNNAVKFTPPNGEIKIVAHAKAKTVLISVENTIYETDHDFKHLFTVGKIRSTPGTAGEKGSGLGLVLCKEFIEANNGKIDVCNNAKTVRFDVEIPKY